MVENTFRVGKTQWSKWNDDGREAYNRIKRQGLSEKAAIAEADAKTAKTEEERRNKKRGLLGTLNDTLDGLNKVLGKTQDAAETVAGVAAAVTPVVTVAKTVVKAAKGKKGK